MAGDRNSERKRVGAARNLKVDKKKGRDRDPFLLLASEHQPERYRHELVNSTLRLAP